MRDIIRGLQMEGTTVFLNSHLLSEVEAVCDHVAIINKGTVVRSGAMKDLLVEKTLSIRCAPLPRGLAYSEDNRRRRRAQRKDGSLILTLKDTEDIPKTPRCWPRIIVGLYELTPRRETLESVFLKAVGEGETA